MIDMEEMKIRAGLDIGAISAKLVVLAPKGEEHAFSENFQKHTNSIVLNDIPHGIWFADPIRTYGDVVKSARQALSALSFFKDFSLELSITGSQGKLVSDILKAPYVNEFKCIGKGTSFFEPNVSTIIEIGGDKSRYLRVVCDKDTDKVTILDYERNGDCAAGTGSFIDQQAERLGIPITEIGDLVMTADATANIAGRCSVFAKSDMIHAQQRGFSPAAIFKGLCEAVVRNYKGTVMRGKALEPGVVFVGGLAANRGVVQAMHDIFKLDELVVPDFPMHVAALGCALLEQSTEIKSDQIDSLFGSYINLNLLPRTRKLDSAMVNINHDAGFTSEENSQSIAAYLGLDIGSVSTNLVLLDKDSQVLDSVYTRTEGKPIEVVLRELALWDKKWGKRVEILGVGTTGSGRELIGELTGADAVNDEITAHKTGAVTIAKILGQEKVDTIFEIGGQDSKFISIQDDIVVDFTMNEACAAGTGSFLEEQASKMGISIKEEFADLAMSSESPIKMGERCTVFMEKDVTAFLQQGIPKNDICAGLSFAVVYNYLNRVVRDRKIGDHIFFQGGTAYNKAVSAAFATVLDKKITIPPFNGVVGAVGAALLAKEKMQSQPGPSRFRGFDLSKVDFKVRNIRCKACSNQCDVQECTVEGEKTYWGDKCSDRFRKKVKFEQKPVIPDLIKTYNDLLLQDMPGPDGLGVRIGVPRTMYYYDQFPFWRTYFAYLGAELVLSDITHKSIVKQGRELAIADPCFPIIAAHGHFMDLLDKDVDYILSPNIVNAQTEFPEKESWYCPWEQTVPYVIKSTIYDQRIIDKMLIPVIRYRKGMDYIKRTMHPFAKKLGASVKNSDKAVDLAFAAQSSFEKQIKQIGRSVLSSLQGHKAVVLLGRPYNLFDSGINLNVPDKLRDQYGMNIIPMEFLPFENIDIHEYHENMFWNYGRKIMQAATFTGQQAGFSAIYITNFKCGPDSYIKHFVGDSLGAPYLTLQFDDHSNDAGIMTRCEAFLTSKGLLSHPNASIKNTLESRKV